MQFYLLSKSLVSNFSHIEFVIFLTETNQYRHSRNQILQMNHLRIK
jgi:hypothetical protein